MDKGSGATFRYQVEEILERVKRTCPASGPQAAWSPGRL